jgi:ribosomal protein S18 acetylase RimI-like enzyme
MQVKLKRATLSDVDSIASLFDAYRQFYQQPSNLPGAQQFLRTRLEQQDSVLFFAYTQLGDTIQAVGFVQLYPSFSSVTMQRLWILNDLFVCESARCHGVAKRLMNRAREHALATHAKGLFLETAHDNTQAQRLYESLGYQKNSEFYYFLNLSDASKVN